MTASVDIIFPRLPPAIDGIGDHTVILAWQLGRAGCRVRILTRLRPGQAESLRSRHGVEAVDAWPSGDLRDTADLTRLIAGRSPDAVILQFEQFAYGSRGFNPELSRVFGVLRRRRPSVRRVLYAHENYTYPGCLSHTAMWTYQRRQFLRLVRDADQVFVTTEEWASRDHLRDAVVLPVFSNLPLARPGSGRSGGAPQRGGPVVWFGYLDEARAPYFTAAVRVLAVVDPTADLVYVGVDGARARTIAAETGFDRLRTVDRPPADRVSQLLGGSRLCLAPFPDGASSRRGSLMAMLQHGCAVVTNVGPGTDGLVRRLAEEGSVIAAPSPSPDAFAVAVDGALLLREEGLAAAAFRARAAYDDRFAPEHVGARLAAMLASPRE